MSAALLSRFDLVFILLDKPDEERDLLLSEHVMAQHAGVDDGNFVYGSILTYSGNSQTSSMSHKSNSSVDIANEPDLLKRLTNQPAKPSPIHPK